MVDLRQRSDRDVFKQVIGVADAPPLTTYGVGELG
jgi:hypothetical protein